MANVVPNYEGLNPWFYESRRIQVEPSTRCPLLCPDCARTQVMASEFINSKGEKDYMRYPGFSIADLSIENFNHFIRPENELKCLHYNANLSDPIYSGTLMKQLDLVNEMDPRPRLFFSTNGSGKPTKFWKLFTSKLRNKDQVGFAIDGLEDTNHIYRINSEWDSIMNGLKIVLSEREPGVNVTWRYIVFSHNSHQVLEAYDKSVELGIDTFKLVKAAPRSGDERQITTEQFKALEQGLIKYASKNLSEV